VAAGIKAHRALATPAGLWQNPSGLGVGGNNNSMNCPQCGMLLYPNGSCPACRGASPTADKAIFRDPKRLTGLLRWLLVTVALIHVAFGACAVLRALMLNAMINDLPAHWMLAAATAANELREGAVGTLLTNVYFGVAFVFAVWTYRVNTNIHALGSNNLRFTPGWAVGWYFIPVANLWMPYQVMRELWLASNNPAGWQAKPTGKLLRWWWASWLASVLFPCISVVYMTRTLVQEDVFGQLMVLEVFGVVSAILGLAAAILACLVVSKIGAAQEQAAERSLSAVFA
jgi:hypothetical protein